LLSAYRCTRNPPTLPSWPTSAVLHVYPLAARPLATSSALTRPCMPVSGSEPGPQFARGTGLIVAALVPAVARAVIGAATPSSSDVAAMAANFRRGDPFMHDPQRFGHRLGWAVGSLPGRSHDVLCRRSGRPS